MTQTGRLVAEVERILEHLQGWKVVKVEDDALRLEAEVVRILTPAYSALESSP